VLSLSKHGLVSFSGSFDGFRRASKKEMEMPSAQVIEKLTTDNWQLITSSKKEGNW